MRYLPAIALLLVFSGCKKEDPPITLVRNTEKPYIRGYMNDLNLAAESRDLYTNVYLESCVYYDQGEEDAVIGYNFTVDLDFMLLRMNFFHLDTLIYTGQPALQSEYYFKKDFTTIRDILGKGDWPILPDTCYGAHQFEPYGIERGVRLSYTDYPMSFDTWHVVSDEVPATFPVHRVTILESDLQEVILEEEDGQVRTDSILFVEGEFGATFYVEGSADSVKFRDVRFGFIYHRFPLGHYLIE